MRKSGPTTDPQQLSPGERSDADDVEQHACPKCDARPGSPCRSRGIPRDKIFSEKISTRVCVRAAFAEALRTAREAEAR